ncbi:MAG: hypothetical protein HS119_02890 [Flavobacteriales bacterium]|nr:hypothetical protein [Flavobacteriales bacterium]
MKDIIKIEHYSSSFLSRIKYLIIIHLGIFLLFGFISFLKKGIDIIDWTLIIITLFIVISLLFNIKQSLIYLSDFYSDKQKVKVKYFYGRREKMIETDINQINIILKNKSRKSGFNCELLLEVNQIKFVIDDTFDWSLKEMMNLYLFIKNSKEEILTENDKDNLSKLKDKIDRGK